MSEQGRSQERGGSRDWFAEEIEAWLDPEAPDPWPSVPAYDLSATGFAVRLLRLLEEHRRAGVSPGVVLGVLKARCEAVVRREPRGAQRER